MIKSFHEKYREEVSESSIITEEENEKKESTDTNPSKAAPSLPPRPTETTRKRPPVTPYTFDPKSFLNEMKSGTKTYADSNAGGTPLGYKPLSGFTPSNDLPYKITRQDSFPLKRSGSFSNLRSDMSMLTNLGDDYKKSEEYNVFAKEFEKEFGNDQKELERIHNELATRTKKLENFTKELENSDTDMILFRSRLMREIEDIRNDLIEAYNHIIVLMGDRLNMKEQFCIFKMKIKKLKGFVKTFQEDIEA